jgi:hypothetical protein
VDLKRPDRIAGPPILGLLLARSPAAIVGLVIPVIIRETVNRVLRRWLASHVGKKIGKRVPPPSTDLNAAPAIILVMRVRWIVATLLHGIPDAVLGALILLGTPCLAVANVTAPATAFRFAGSQVRSWNGTDAPALTLACPNSPSPTLRMALQGEPVHLPNFWPMMFFNPFG